MKVAIISDTHFGVRGDSQAHLDHQVRFLREIFWPTCEAEGVETILHLGDLVDRRKYINFRTASVMRREFLDMIGTRDMIVVAGNHDCFHRNTNDVNALREIAERDNITVVDHDATVYNLGGGQRVLFVPWISDANREQVMARLEKGDGIAMGHFELNGYKMYSNTPEMSHGMNPKVLDRFDAVLSGHFHHPSAKGNVAYVGAPYEMTWSDAGDPRGFHIWDTTDPLKFRFIQNSLRLFRKIHYEDGAKLPDSVEGQIVKVIVGKREDGLAYDRFMKKLEEQSPADVHVVEDHLNMDLDLDDSEVENVGIEDTAHILRSSVDELEADVDKPALSSLLLDAYQEAMATR